MIYLFLSFSHSIIEVRIKGSEILKKMLEQWSAECFAKNEAVIEKALRLGLVDATPQVREISRSCFWQYLTLFPTRAPRFVGYSL
jgi:hypothetical protein